MDKSYRPLQLVSRTINLYFNQWRNKLTNRTSLPMLFSVHRREYVPETHRSKYSDATVHQLSFPFGELRHGNMTRQPLTINNEHYRIALHGIGFNIAVVSVTLVIISINRANGLANTTLRGHRFIQTTLD